MSLLFQERKPKPPLGFLCACSQVPPFCFLECVVYSPQEEASKRFKKSTLFLCGLLFVYHMMKKYIYCVGIYLLLATGAAASETVGTVTTGGNEGFAWSDQAGWVNFGTANGAITIQDSGITGYAWIPNYGRMNMNPSNGGVSVAAGGALSGYAWSSALGWVNFSGVSINSSGVFTGQATGASIGTLTFSCTNCSVKTDYRPPALETTSTESSSGSSGGATPGEPTPASLLPSPADAIPFTINAATGGGLPWVWIAVGIFGLVLLATFFIAKRRMIKKV